MGKGNTLAHVHSATLTHQNLTRGEGGAGLERDGSGFVYVVDNRRPRVSDERIKAALREYCAMVGGRAFGAREFDDWEGKPCAAGTINNRLRGWSRALKVAGIEGGRPADYGPAALMENLREVWRKKGRVPGQHDMRKYGPYSMAPYKDRWGSVRKACIKLAKFERGEIGRGELLRGEGMERRAIRPRERWEVLERGGHRCCGCGRGAGEVKLEVDHIVPVCKGGSDDVSNLRVLCVECNRRRGGGKKAGKRGRWAGGQRGERRRTRSTLER